MRRIKARLCQHIDNSERVKVVYKGLEYIIDPYLVFEDQHGREYVHGYKLSGGYIKMPGPHWGNFVLGEITYVEAVGTYTAPLQGYKPHSKMFPHVLHEWKLKGRKHP